MTRFFFDTHDGERLCRDTDGLDLTGEAEARQRALDALPDMARENMPADDLRTFLVVVRDHRGREIYTAKLILIGWWAEARN